MTKQRSGKNWTREETLIAFRLYCRTPFGKLHQHNPDILALAQKLGRTPSAVGMKACNFASLDPTQQERGIKGLPNRSHFESEIWEGFHKDSQAIAAEAEQAYEHLLNGIEPVEAMQPMMPAIPTGPTEETRMIRARRVQGFFRGTVLISYGYRCALTGLCVPELLNASHIIPWSRNEHRRADPCNGLCLNALHDRAFDRGLITFDENLRAVVSPRLHDQATQVSESTVGRVSANKVGRASRPSASGDLPEFHQRWLCDIEGQSLRLPIRFAPDMEAMRYHRENVFQAG